MKSEIPIYLQLRNQIVMGIGKGEFEEGELLPTVRQMAADLGIFDGAESGKCRMYVWLEQSEVIQIKTKKYTVFMNNKDKDQTTAWYEQLKKAEP